MIYWRIEWLDRVSSTMDVAAERAQRGVPAGTVIVADEQTAGRGREGRRWFAPAGTSLLFTVIARPPLAVVQNPMLSVAIAERVAAALMPLTGLPITIKEPNDLMVNGRKLAGILCQSRITRDQVDYLLIGIGLNVNIPPDQLPLPTATSLLAETGRVFDRHALLDAVLHSLRELPGVWDRQ